MNSQEHTIKRLLPEDKLILKKFIEDETEKYGEYDIVDKIEKFLIESYYSPFFKQPFSKNIGLSLRFMDYIADYLCSFVKQSKEKPLISVIMAAYNRKDIIMDSINSVLTQNYYNFELIIVDDASTDGTAEFLDKIEHDKIRVLFHEENKDCCGARNTGLKEVHGNYITYLDSDNLMGKKFLEANLGMFLKFPDADCVYSAQSRHDNHESPAHTILFGALNKSGLLNRNFVDSNTIFHKKEILDKLNGFDETLDREIDWDFILRTINNNYKIYCAPFLQSKYFSNLASNRMSKKHTNAGIIRENNARFYSDYSELNKKVNIIIPIQDSQKNIMDCLNSILSLNINNNVKITLLNNNPQINLNELDLKSSDNNIIEAKPNLRLVELLKNSAEYCGDEEDLLILNPDAVLTRGSIEAMQKYAYELNECGLIVSQQLMKNSPTIKKYFDYVNLGYWIDTTPFEFDNNIVNMPIFYDGEILELRFSPFFCTYLKREVLDKINDFNFKSSNERSIMIHQSNFIRHELGLKIYHISDAKVFRK